MDWNLLYYFTDPVLRAPMLGSMLMSLVAGLVGVLVVLRKQSLLGEALSHAAYPGVILGIIVLGVLWESPQNIDGTVFILAGAFVTAWLGLWAIHFLVRKLKVKADTALCFTLSVFIGIGITLASEVQFSFTGLYKQTQIYFYGQVATMTDIHIYIYSLLALVVITTLVLVYKEMQVYIFDRTYAKSLGLPVNSLDWLLYALIVLSVIIGIRSAGVILMSAMLIAPAVAARQYTHKLGRMFVLSGIIGMLSGFLGNVLSIHLSKEVSLPTGPSIVLIAAAFCFLSLLIAPKRGILFRWMRKIRFRFKCISENVLKGMWQQGKKKEISFSELKGQHFASSLYLHWVLASLIHHGWVKKTESENYALTASGTRWAAQIVRLHRLWEVYLVQYMGMGIERVHRNAEEMEHIITPELEEELSLLLTHPEEDPHHQPIPPKLSGGTR